jgi:hypothetical protein
MIAIGFAQLVERRTPGFVLRDPALRVLPAPHIVEQLLHRAARVVGDDLRAAGVVAVLGGVADRVAHVVQPALVDQVDDQLQLVEALEVRDLGLVAGFDERLEAGLDERAHAAAQHRLLAEQIGLGFLGERCLDDAGAHDADALGVRQRQRARLARRVLLDREQRRRPGALDEQLADAVARRLRGDHRDVEIGARRDRAEADVEAVREHQHVARLQVRLDLLTVDLPLHVIGDENHHDVGPRRDLAHLADRETRRLRFRARTARRRQADANAHAAVFQIQRMRVPLRAVPDDSDLASANQREVGVVVVIHRGHERNSLFRELANW